MFFFLRFSSALPRVCAQTLAGMTKATISALASTLIASPPVPANETSPTYRLRSSSTCRCRAASVRRTSALRGAPLAGRPLQRHVRRPADQNEHVTLQGSTTASPARRDSRQWANVLVHVEEVARIVLGLELLEI